MVAEAVSDSKPPRSCCADLLPRRTDAADPEGPAATERDADLVADPGGSDDPDEQGTAADPGGSAGTDSVQPWPGCCSNRSESDQEPRCRPC